jgi:hypothetical protein
MKVTSEQVWDAYSRWQNLRGTVEGTLAMVEFRRLNRLLAQRQMGMVDV